MWLQKYCKTFKDPLDVFIVLNCLYKLFLFTVTDNKNYNRTFAKIIFL